MTDHKNIDRICIIIGIVTLMIGFMFSYFGEAIGLTTGTTADHSYVTTLFDDSKVHEINIEMSEDEWNTLQENATEEEYLACDVTIDGETLENVAIRPKGNSSLSSVASSDSERYSFKINFDKYNESLSYDGLDKLNLNNIISDNTYLKNYLCYDMMNYMGIDAPLTSFIKVSINGEYFGLYLAVEGIDDAFAQRNYGSEYGNIYKPENSENEKEGIEEGNQERPDTAMIPPENQDNQAPATDQADFEAEEASVANQRPEMGMPPEQLENADETQQSNIEGQVPEKGQRPEIGQMDNQSSGDDVALIYSDDEVSSYEGIWDGAVFDVTTSDKKTAIESIKQLNEGENLEEIVEVEEVLKYFVVHSYVNNYDSYTGSMKHNYYLRENDGQLSVIAWDYNLSFMTFMGMGGSITANSTLDEATKLVNYPIDTPVSNTTMEERPLLNELLSNEAYLEEYHSYYEEFVSSYFESGRCEETIDQAVALISEDVENDPTAFCTYEEYQEGVATLKEFCNLRAESISGQLDGTILSTATGQLEEPDTLIDASNIDVSAMGTMTGGEKDTQMIPNVVTESDETTNADNLPAGDEETMSQQIPMGDQPPMDDTNQNQVGGQNVSLTGDESETVSDNVIQGNNDGGIRDNLNKEDGSNAVLESNTTTGIALVILSALALIGGLLLTKRFRRR